MINSLPRLRAVMRYSCGDATEEDLLRGVERCLERLEVLLADDSPYLFGDRPCALDAQVYGYVAVIRAADMPNPWLRGMLEGRQKLMRHCERIEKLHFSGTAREQVMHPSYLMPRDPSTSIQHCHNRPLLLFECVVSPQFSHRFSFCTCNLGTQKKGDHGTSVFVTAQTERRVGRRSGGRNDPVWTFSRPSSGHTSPLTYSSSYIRALTLT